MNTIEEEQISEKEVSIKVESEVKKPKKLLQVKNLKTYFYTEEGVVKAVDGVSFDIYEDEIMGLVGETGCGKSVTALSILQLVREPGKIIEGSIIYKESNVLDLPESEMREFRGNNMTMIFQDPLNSLNPVISAGDQVGEVFLLHQKDDLKRELDERLLKRRNKKEEIKNLKKELKTKERELTKEERNEISERILQLKKETYHVPVLKDIVKDRSEKIIKEIGIADARGILQRYPHEFSGGMLQRALIAMALACNPDILIMDEPTTALDVITQAKLFLDLERLQNKIKLAMILVTHDLALIAALCQKIIIMYAGKIVEYADAKRFFKNSIQ